MEDLLLPHKLAIIDRQLTDWQAGRYSSEIQMRTQKILGADDNVKHLAELVARCDAAIEFLSKERQKLTEQLPIGNKEQSNEQQ